MSIIGLFYPFLRWFTGPARKFHLTNLRPDGVTATAVYLHGRPCDCVVWGKGIK